MTIGIAGTGPWAGGGILAGLRAVEAVGRGALGGFVSLAVLTEDQKLLRADTQNGGMRALFEGESPEVVLRAPYAALISSGPDRPAPLSQFVAAAPGVGIVTGHRFPQIVGNNGAPLNRAILEAMQQGSAPQAAIDGVIAKQPSFDSGFVALNLNSEIGLGNMPSVLRRADQGAAICHCDEVGARVATIHNAIHPHKTIAILANEVSLEHMRRRSGKVVFIAVASGVKLSFGDVPEIYVDQNLETMRVMHPEANSLDVETAFGLGDKVKVTRLGTHLGWLDHEPLMLVKNRTVVALDGKDKIELPVFLREIDPSIQ